MPRWRRAPGPRSRGRARCTARYHRAEAPAPARPPRPRRPPSRRWWPPTRTGCRRAPASRWRRRRRAVGSGRGRDLPGVEPGPDGFHGVLSTELPPRRSWPGPSSRNSAIEVGAPGLEGLGRHGRPLEAEAHRTDADGAQRAVEVHRDGGSGGRRGPRSRAVARTFLPEHPRPRDRTPRRCPAGPHDATGRGVACFQVRRARPRPGWCHIAHRHVHEARPDVERGISRQGRAPRSASSKDSTSESVTSAASDTRRRSSGVSQVSPSRPEPGPGGGRRRGPRR